MAIGLSFMKKFWLMKPNLAESRPKWLLIANILLKVQVMRGLGLMQLEFVPLLQIQRDLYAIPRGLERFKSYLETMVDAETRDLELPLVAMNPMGKDHVPALLDQYLVVEADKVAAEAVAEATTQLEPVSGAFKVTLVIADDAMGLWTNRYATEFGHRFESKPLFKRGWLTGLLWTSETPSAQAARESALTAIFRGAYIQQQGFAKTLGEMLAQEGYATAMAGCTQPALDPDDLAYTHEVLAPLLETSNHAIIMACLFGDEVARTLGYTPQGLSPRAGFALALHEARVK